VGSASLERARAIARERNTPDEQVESAQSAVRTREMQLRALGMGDRQLADLSRTGQFTSEIELVSPIDGIIVDRNISAEQACERGLELYRIADIGKVWITASLFENEQKAIRPGAKARVSSIYFPDILSATAGRAAPFTDSTSQTILLLHADNPRHLLRLDMELDLEFLTSGPVGMSIHSDAVLNGTSGRIAYVQTSDEVFEQRMIETAESFDDRVIITRGLMVGEKVVTSGTFLLDSASRMQAPHLQ
jgi:multidrug efflux pump subunit AcrA (membrane-fusion protein)